MDDSERENEVQEFPDMKENDAILGEVDHNHIPHGEENMSMVKGPTHSGSGVLLANVLSYDMTTKSFKTQTEYTKYGHVTCSVWLTSHRYVLGKLHRSHHFPMQCMSLSLLGFFLCFIYGWSASVLSRMPHT